MTLAVVLLFVGLMVWSSLYSRMQSLQVQQNVTDGTTCILGNIAGREGHERPDPAVTEAACERYLNQVEE